MDALGRLQAWFESRCDGEWEHAYGVEIETLDNPGWLVTVDLSGTPWVRLSAPPRHQERTASDWIRVEVANGKYSGAGGPMNLSELIEDFLRLVGDTNQG